MKIVVLDGSAANPGDLSWDAFKVFGDLTVYDITTQDQLLERAKDADIALTNKSVFSKEAIESLPKLKYIGVLATGYNVVDLEACKERGIIVTNVPEYATFATMQMTIALLLELTNKVGLHSEAVKQGEWVRSEQFCFWKSPLMELYGKTIAVVGFGKIGQQVSKVCLELGLNVIFVPHSPSKYPEGKTTIAGRVIRMSTLDEAFKTADIITFHCPLNAESKGIICESNLSKCKPSALIINTARGPLAVESDVAKALNTNKIAGYACDVVSAEPMSSENPLLTAKNCIITPHIAWAPKETRARLLEVAAGNIRCFIDNNPINTVC